MWQLSREGAVDPGHARGKRPEGERFKRRGTEHLPRKTQWESTPGGWGRVGWGWMGWGGGGGEGSNRKGSGGVWWDRVGWVGIRRGRMGESGAEWDSGVGWESAGTDGWGGCGQVGQGRMVWGGVGLCGVGWGCGLALCIPLAAGRGGMGWDVIRWDLLGWDRMGRGGETERRGYGMGWDGVGG